MTPPLSAIPTLTTERLVLRAMTPRDWPDYCAMMGSTRAAFMGGPFDVPAAWGMFCHDMAGWVLFGVGALMLEQDAATIGQVGISHGSLFPEPELGWYLYAGYEGFGYATEAAHALRTWSYQTQKVTNLVSYTDANNRASHAVAERLGAVRDPKAIVQGAGDIVYRHPAREARPC